MNDVMKPTVIVVHGPKGDVAKLCGTPVSVTHLQNGNVHGPFTSWATMKAFVAAHDHEWFMSAVKLAEFAPGCKNDNPTFMDAQHADMEAQARAAARLIQVWLLTIAPDNNDIKYDIVFQLNLLADAFGWHKALDEQMGEWVIT